MGSAFDTTSRRVAIWSRAMSNPHSSDCGKRKAGMNWTAWNSVRARALRNNPSAMPSKALTIAGEITIQTNTSGSSSSAVASDTRARCPLESSLTMRPAKSSRPTW